MIGGDGCQTTAGPLERAGDRSVRFTSLSSWTMSIDADGAHSPGAVPVFREEDCHVHALSLGRAGESERSIERPTENGIMDDEEEEEGGGRRFT